VETLLEPISEPKSLAVTLSDFHWNMNITFLNTPNTLEPHPYWTKESIDFSNPKLIHFFVYYNKHNQWLCLLFFVDNMLFDSSNDAI
jgi:hypothetical protein